MSKCGVYRSDTLPDRFWSKVQKSDGCWEWIGYKDKHGYGLIGLLDRLERAHRISWELNVGQIPAGLFVLHRCDNPSCVKPDHLFVGTQQDNLADMRNKGRLINGSAKIRFKDAQMIRAKYSNLESDIKMAAREYGLKTEAVKRILRRESWKTDPREPLTNR